MKKVSAIVEVSSEEAYNTVQALLDQTQVGMEILLFGSAEAVMEDCREQFPGDIRVAAGLNEALNAAQGEYVTFWKTGDTAQPEYLQAMLQAASGADLVGADYEKNGLRVRVADSMTLDTDDAKAEFLGLPGGLEGRLYRRTFVEEHRLRFPRDNPFGDQQFYFLAVLFACSYKKAQGLWYAHKAKVYARDDEEQYRRLEIPGGILRECQARGVYAAHKDLVDYKYIAMQMGNIRLICMEGFTYPDIDRVDSIRQAIAADCPDYASGRYFDRTLWQFRYYLEKAMKSPYRAVKAYKHDKLLDIRAEIRARMGKK